MSASSTPLPDFYRWGFSTAPLKIHLSLEVVTGIRRQIQGAAKAPGALYQGGLLIGIAQPGITRILDFEPLGPLDASSFEPPARTASGEVVGFYRTIPAATTLMTDEDKVLAAKFPQPTSVFLLIETIKSSIGNARFCFWGDGELFDWPVMMFPFAPEELASREPQPRPSMVQKLSQSLRTGITPKTPPSDKMVGAAPEFTHRAVAPQVAPQPVAASAPVPVAPPVTLQPVAASAPVPVAPPDDRQKSLAPPVARPGLATGRPWLTWALLAAVLVLALALGLFSIFRPGSRLPVVTPPVAASSVAGKTPLGLAVEKRGDGLLVSWNGNTPIVSKANFGMLLIRGTGVSRDVPISAEELRAGGFVYTMAADELKFQLNVVAGEQVAREFLTVVRSQIPDGPARLSRSPGRNFRPAALPAQPVFGRPASQPVTQPATQPLTQPLREVRQFNPAAPTQSAAAPPQHIEEPPAVGDTAPVNTGTLSVLNQTPVSVPTPANTQAITPANTQLTQIPQSESSPSSLAAEAHPPVAKLQVMPALPALLRGKLWDPTIVEVKISVDASGSVVNAVATAKPGVSPLLRDEAAKAARRWKFQPAEFNGHPVPAEIVVQFKFAASH
jgi:periplasmic protein TonB